MADITVTCKECGTSITLSEYAKPDNLLCPACKKPMSMPELQLPSSDRFLPEQIRRVKAEAAIEDDPDKPRIQLKDIPGQIHNNRRRRVRMEGVLPTIKAALLFVVLAGALVYLRYFDGYKMILEPTDFDSLKFGGALAILFFHVVIVVEAMTTNFLTGLLCLLIPGYSLYYLFTESDSFWLRSIVMALVVAFGPDFVYYVKDYAMSVFNFVNAWLEAGGEFNKPFILK
jgi:hypothetical protein